MKEELFWSYKSCEENMDTMIPPEYSCLGSVVTFSEPLKVCSSSVSFCSTEESYFTNSSVTSVTGDNCSMTNTPVYSHLSLASIDCGHNNGNNSNNSNNYKAKSAMRPISKYSRSRSTPNLCSNNNSFKYEKYQQHDRICEEDDADNDNALMDVEISSADNDYVTDTRSTICYESHASSTGNLFQLGNGETVIRKKQKRVTLYGNVVVVPIPSRNEYSDHVRQRLWSNAIELSQNAARNSLEFAAEGFDWRNATEDDNMYVCSVSGEQIHPVHYLLEQFKRDQEEHHQLLLKQQQKQGVVETSSQPKQQLDHINHGACNNNTIMMEEG